MGHASSSRAIVFLAQKRTMPTGAPMPRQFQTLPRCVCFMASCRACHPSPTSRMCFCMMPSCSVCCKTSSASNVDKGRADPACFPSTKCCCLLSSCAVCSNPGIIASSDHQFRSEQTCSCLLPSCLECGRSSGSSGGHGPVLTQEVLVDQCCPGPSAIKSLPTAPPTQASACDKRCPDWASWQLQCLRQNGWQLPLRHRRLRVATGCGGTDAPIEALACLAMAIPQLLSFEFVAIAERWAAARRFSTANHMPNHVYKDVDDLSCLTCTCSLHPSRAEPCTEDLSNLDIFVAGFPCKPFSCLNPKRWKEGVDPMSTAEAKPFFSIVKFLWRRPPKLVILENVPGMAMGRTGAPAAARPLAFVLRGERLAPDGSMTQWGLELIPHYMVKWIHVGARLSGLSQIRKRIYFVMVRRDIGGDELLETVISKIKHLTCLRSGIHIRNILLDPGDVLLQRFMCASTAPRSQAPMKHSTAAAHAAFRRAHGLPPAGTSEGDPHTVLLVQHGLTNVVHSFTARQQDLINVAVLMNRGTDDIIIDVSQALYRRPWRKGDVQPTLTTSSA